MLSLVCRDQNLSFSFFAHRWLIRSSPREQCDEAHPTCRNCVKSKRECLGYDPIFKSQPGPAPIQPAPSAAPSMQPHLATSSPYPPPPQGYMPAGSQPYPPSLTAGATSPDSSEPYDYAAAIDPALEGPSTTHMQVNPLYDGTHEAKLGGALHSHSPLPALHCTVHFHSGNVPRCQLTETHR